MARPSAAAGGIILLACAVLLLFAGQSAATNSFPFAAYFPAGGYVATIVRIYSRDREDKDTKLNMAVRNGEVVLVTATYDYKDDETQLWWKISPPTSLADGEGAKYWLVNFATKQAMTSPTGDGQPVLLEPFTPAPLSSGGSQLWVQGPPLDRGFYQIKPYTNDDMALNGLYGIYAGTKIGIYHSPPVTSNTLWLLDL